MCVILVEIFIPMEVVDMFVVLVRKQSETLRAVRDFSQTNLVLIDQHLL